MSTIFEYAPQWFPSYGDLPMEIILDIFRYLEHPDLQAAGATCTRWREALFDPEFNDKTCVRFAKVCLSDRLKPASDYLKCDRPFRYFRLEEVTFGPVQELMNHIGRTATEIIFDNADLSDKQFYGIMRQLSGLRHLVVTRCSPLFMSGSFLDNDDERTGVHRNFANIRHLSLRDNQYLSDAILLRLTAMIPVIESLDMSECHIAYHSAIQRRFYPPNSNDNNLNENGNNNNSLENLNPSESILTFKFIQHVLTQHRAHLRELNFSNTFIGGLALIALTQMDHGGLQLLRLRLAYCRQLNILGLKTFLQTQPQLVVLELSHTMCVNDESIESIVTSTPLLEELYIAGCSSITNEGAALLGTLRHLQRLDISRCYGITSDGIMRGIARAPNRVLQELHMMQMNVCVDGMKCVARNLTELRVLNIGYCVNGVSDDSVQCIIENLRWLRELSLEACFRVTDTALTGINVDRLGLKTESVSSLNSFNPPPTSSLAERLSLNSSTFSMKISLRSKVEEEIIQDANRKRALFAAHELNLIKDSDVEGYNIQQLRGLRSLNLKGCYRITDVSLKYGLKFRELRHLMIANCQQISVLGMESVAVNCPSIEELDISDCFSITDKCVQVLTTKLLRLRALHISGCSQLTDHSLDAILVNCKRLQTLSVYRCHRMYTDIESRLAELPTLRSLNMDNSGSMDNADFFRFKKGLDY